MTRSFRPPELERARRRDQFDPVAAGAAYRLSPKQSLDLWQLVTEAVEQSAGRLDVKEAGALFAKLAARWAVRGGQLRPSPGRLTRVGVELGDDSLEPWRFDELTSRPPGRTTLVLAEEQRARPRDKTAGIAREDVAVPQPREHAELPGASDVAQAMAALQSGTSTSETAEVPPTDVPRLDGPAAIPPSNETQPRLIGWAARESRPLAELFGRQLRTGVTPQPEPSGPVRLPASLKERMERAFGRRFDDVEIHPNSTEVQAGQSALTRERHIHLEPGAVDLTSPRGEQIIAHELAHVAQQSSTGAGGERVGTRKQLELEAQRAAAVAVQGGMARVALRAQPMAAYGFSEGDAEPAGDQADEAHEPHDTHDDAAHADAHELEAKPHDIDPHAGSEAKHEEGADHGGTVAEDSHAGDAGLSGDDLVLGVVPAEDGAPGATSGGGGPAAKPQKQAPNVAAAKPEVGLGQLQGVRPDKLAPVLGQVHTAAGADVAKARAAQQAKPPKQMTSGASATAPGAKPKDAGGSGAKPNEAGAPGGTVAAGAKKADPDHPVKAEVPGGESAKQAQQGQAAQQQQTAGQVVAKVAQSIASWFSGWAAPSAATVRARTPTLPR